MQQSLLLVKTKTVKEEGIKREGSDYRTKAFTEGKAWQKLLHTGYFVERKLVERGCHLVV